MKRNKATTNHKQIFWHCFSNLLFVNCIVLGYSSLNISSTIRDLKLKGMPKYKQVWTCYTYIFAPYIWLAHNYMKIWFRNISSAKLKWKECTRRIKHDCCSFLYYGWLKLDISFSTSIDSFVYLFFCLFVCFLPITDICLVSEKKSQNFNVINFCIAGILFQHKCNHKNLTLLLWLLHIYLFYFIFFSQKQLLLKTVVFISFNTNNFQTSKE